MTRTLPNNIIPIVCRVNNIALIDLNSYSLQWRGFLPATLFSNTEHHMTHTNSLTLSLSLIPRIIIIIFLPTHTHTLSQTHTVLPFGVKIMLATLCQCRGDHFRDGALLGAHDHDSMLKRGHCCRVDTHQATSLAGHGLVGGLLDLGLLHRLGGETIA